MPSPELLESIRASVEDLGFELVDFRHGGPTQRPQLQLRIDRPGSSPGHGVTAEDCVRASRAVERALEARGLVGSRYVLQVSSPGIDRPVRFPEHWRRYRGRQVRLLKSPLPGKPRAEILAVPDDQHVRLRLADGEERELALAEIREATLVPEPTELQGIPTGRGS